MEKQIPAGNDGAESLFRSMLQLDFMKNVERLFYSGYNAESTVSKRRLRKETR